MSSAHEQPSPDSEVVATGSEEVADDGGVSPEAYLLYLLGVGVWVAAICYVGVHYAWPWSWAVALGPFVVLIVKGSFWPSDDPVAERRAERDRKLADEEAYIASIGGHEDTERPEETQQAIHDARLRQVAIHNEFLENERAPRAAKTPSRPTSAPRRVLRWVAQALVLLIMIPLAVVFYGSLLLGPSLLVAGGVSLVVESQWALLLSAGLTLPLGGWLVWWWIRRAPDSTVRMASAGMAAGAGFGGGGGP